MFQSQDYWEVNREERHYCALFAHALLCSRVVRTRFALLIANRFGVKLDPDHLEVYIEAAALRDYWNDLGDPVAYTPDTHQGRRVVIESLLLEVGLPPDIVDEHDFFWTTARRRKLWSPGRWSEPAIKAAGLDPLLEVKWAFNAKPDVMVVSTDTVVLIEAKVESGEGRDGGSGYKQFETQRLIATLLRRLVPSFRTSQFVNTVLELRPGDGLSWSDIIAIVDTDEVDHFTRSCLAHLI